MRGKPSGFSPSLVISAARRAAKIGEYVLHTCQFFGQLVEKSDHREVFRQADACFASIVIKMKFIHLSDLHLGKRVNEYPMIEDQEYILKKIINVIDDEKPSGIISILYMTAKTIKSY